MLQITTVSGDDVVMTLSNSGTRESFVKSFGNVKLWIAETRKKFKIENAHSLDYIKIKIINKITSFVVIKKIYNNYKAVLFGHFKELFISVK